MSKENKSTATARTAKATTCCNTSSSMLGAWMAIGAGIGTALGAAFGNIGFGLAFGPGLGMLFGMYLDKRKRAEKAGSLD